MRVSSWVQTSGAFMALMCMMDTCVNANGLRNPPEGATATGLGLGKIAQVDDPSAAVHNPARLGGATESAVMISATFASLNVDFKSPEGRSGSNKDSINVLPAVFGVHPISDELTLGLGVTVPFGQATEWEKDGPFRGVAPYLAELYTLTINPSLALKLNDRLSVAAGVSVIQTEIETKQQLVSPTDPAAPAADAKASGDDTTFGWNLAAQFMPADGHAVGVTYRSGFEADYSGDTEISGAPPPFAPRSGFNTEIEFPAIVGMGYALALNDRLTVGVDAEWTEFSSYDALPLDFGANGPFLPFPPALRQDWDDAWSYGVGFNYDIDEEWTARAGWDFFESPVPPETLSPTLPDSDRHAFSVGLGMQRDVHRFDIAYAVSIHDEDVTANDNPFYIGSYDMDRHIVAVSYVRDL